MKKLIILALILILVSLFSLGLAASESEFGFRALYNFATQNTPNDDFELYYDIFILHKLPRILLAILVGALLASSGAVVQSVFLNPLADPYIIGIASAATFGAVIAYILGLSEFYYGIFAFFASAALSICILLMYRQNIATLLIFGIAISAFLGSFTSLFIYLIGEDSFKITAWLMGYLGGASWQKVAILLPPTLLCLGFFYHQRFVLDILLCGDEEANSLGVNAFRAKVIFLLSASLAVAFSVAFCGMISFVGLITPHILRMFYKSSSNALILPSSVFLGAIFLLFCDDVARLTLYPTEIPIGVITAFFGAPFFIFLAIRSARA